MAQRLCLDEDSISKLRSVLVSQFNLVHVCLIIGFIFGDYCGGADVVGTTIVQTRV